MEYYNNIQAVTYEEVQDIVTMSAIQHGVQRGNIVRLRRACYDKPALHRVESFPLRYKQAIKEKFKKEMGWKEISEGTVANFKEKLTGRIFCFFTLHMDHVGVIARRESAKLIVEKVKEIAKNYPAIVTGDFNVDQNNEIYSIFTNSGILNDSYYVARQKFTPNGTFNSFDPSLKTGSRIDHIFVSPTIEILNYAIMTNTYWTCSNTAMDKQGNDAPTEISLTDCQQRCPSDHWPVFVKLKL